MMKVFVSNGDSSVASLMRNKGYSIAETPTASDLVVFTGGADITPILYGERCLAVTNPSFPRDLVEINMWKALDPSHPKVGICRGAQLGNVLCGGRMWQNVNNHAGPSHDVVTVDGQVVRVNSAHHQGIIPTKEAVIEARANVATEKDSEFRKITLNLASNLFDDVEALYYPNFNFLGVQWHPEWGASSRAPHTDYFWHLFDSYYTPNKVAI